MDKNLKTMWILLMIISIILAIMSFIAIQITGENNQCMISPLIYGANKASRSNNADFSCICSLNKPNTPKVFFNSKEVKVLGGDGLGQITLNFNTSIIEND